MPDAEVQLADLHRLCGMHLCLVPESRTLGGPGGMLPMEIFYNRTLKCNFLRAGGGGVGGGGAAGRGGGELVNWKVF